jgi:hypothetical protein
MASTVLSRTTHYDTLGLEPTASLAEIERAFAWGVSPFRPRPIGGVAQVSIAYQTLRDPERRRAYDESIGIRPEPKLAPRPLHSGASFRVAAPLHPAERFAAVTPPQPPERAVGSFIAASLRAQPEPRAAVAPPPVEMPRAPARVSALPEDEAGETGINRTALSVGGVVLAVILIGAWAGLEAGDPGDAEQAKAELSTALPKARPVTSAAAAEPAPSRAEAPRVRRPLAFASLRTRHARPTARAVAVAEADPPAHHSYYETTGADGTPEIAVAEEPAAPTASAPAQATPASMPLPDRVVARTIHKIGYACGQVASTSAVDGQPGVFNVTCTSGHSYRAAPVHGRYRFRRSN